MILSLIRIQLSVIHIYRYLAFCSICEDVLAKALNDVDLDGLYFDIVRELLTTIFRLQDEDREEAADEKDIKGLQLKKCR